MTSTINIKKSTGRKQDGALWVRGTVDAYTFDALVFAEHAERESYELGTSRISKLWIQRTATKHTTFNFDRGMDIEPRDEATKAIVEALKAELATRCFGR